MKKILIVVLFSLLFVLQGCREITFEDVVPTTFGNSDDNYLYIENNRISTSGDEYAPIVDHITHEDVTYYYEPNETQEGFNVQHIVHTDHLMYLLLKFDKSNLAVITYAYDSQVVKVITIIEGIKNSNLTYKIHAIRNDYFIVSPPTSIWYDRNEGYKIALNGEMIDDDAGVYASYEFSQNHMTRVADDGIYTKRDDDLAWQKIMPIRIDNDFTYYRMDVHETYVDLYYEYPIDSSPREAIPDEPNACYRYIFDTESLITIKAEKMDEGVYVINKEFFITYDIDLVDFNNEKVDHRTSNVLYRFDESGSHEAIYTFKENEDFTDHISLYDHYLEIGTSYYQSSFLGLGGSIHNYHIYVFDLETLTFIDNDKEDDVLTPYVSAENRATVGQYTYFIEIREYDIKWLTHNEIWCLMRYNETADETDCMFYMKNNSIYTSSLLCELPNYVISQSDYRYVFDTIRTN